MPCQIGRTLSPGIGDGGSGAKAVVGLAAASTQDSVSSLVGCSRSSACCYSLLQPSANGAVANVLNPPPEFRLQGLCPADVSHVARP